MSNRITIVIPVYNTDLSKLERCIRSIPNHDSVYVSIYDDCSTKYIVSDELKKILNSDPSLDYLFKKGNKIIRLDENKGLGAVRNKAIIDLYNSGFGESYVIFLDSDDELTLSYNIIDYVLKMDNEAYSYGISLISKCGECTNLEYSEKYLNQSMIPYLVTSTIYKVRVLVNEGILFDESRRVFEDIPFSIKFWSYMLSYHDDKYWDGINCYCHRTSIYNYYLDGESLTRTDKKLRLIDDLSYWIEWIKYYYNSISDEYQSNKLKPYLFNRIRYEAVKLLSMEMEVNDDLDRYSEILRLLKPYHIDSILN